MDYTAFISYSHSADGKLAPALQAALQQFARPWYRMRAMAVFRDETSLAATPELWGTIVEALSRSKFFVLMASPASAKSVWVGREIEWWLQHRSIERLILVLTEGTLVWNEQNADFDHETSTGLPDALRGRFSTEPLWIDLTWARHTNDLSLRHTRFRSAVLDIAAPMHGRPKDELDGDDVRQHRRFRQASWAAGLMLAVLTAAATFSAYRATLNAEVARQQERIAVSRQLAALSSGLVDRRFDTALLLAVQATRETPTFEAQKALLSALTHKGTPSTFLRGSSGRVTALRFSGNGRRLAVAHDGASGRELVVWDVIDKQITRQLPGESGNDFVNLAFSAQNPQIHAVDSNGNVFFWGLKTNKADHVSKLRHSAAWEPQFSSDGLSLIFLDYDSSQISNWEFATSKAESVNIDLSILPDPISLASDASGTRFALGSEGGIGTVWDTSEYRELRSIYLDDEIDILAVALSPDGNRLAYGGRTGALFLAPTVGTEATPLQHGSARIEKIEFAPDDRWLATLDRDGSLFLWDATLKAPGPRPVGDSTASAFVFAPDGSSLAVGHEDGTVVLWDLIGRTRLGPVDIGLPERWMTIAVDHADNKMAAMRTDGSIERFEPSSGGPPVSRPWIAQQTGVAGMIFGHDPHSMILGKSNGDVQIINTETNAVSADFSLPSDLRDSTSVEAELTARAFNGGKVAASHPNSEASRVALGPEGRRVALETSSGAIALWDVEAETVICTRPIRVRASFPRAPQELVEIEPANKTCKELQDDRQSYPPTVTNEFSGRPRMVFDGHGNLVMGHNELGTASVVRIDSRSGEWFGGLLASATPQNGVKSSSEFPLEGGALAIGPNRRWLVAGSFEARMKAWDLNMRVPVAVPLEGEFRAATAAAVSPDGNLVAGSDRTGRIAIWDIETRRRLGEFSGDRSLVELSFDPTGQWLIALTESGRLLAWPIGLENLQRKACTIAGRNLTKDEWSQFVGTQSQCATICPGQPAACPQP